MKKEQHKIVSAKLQEISAKNVRNISGILQS